MLPFVLTVELVPLVAHTNKRAVAFLKGHKNLTASIAFEAVADGPVGKRLKHRMTLWIEFKPDTKGKFHRFKNMDEKYKDCFVFIDIDAQMRLYGFSCHPRPRMEGFELIVLTDYEQKKEDHTNLAALERVLKWKDDPATQDALLTLYQNTEQP